MHVIYILSLPRAQLQALRLDLPKVLGYYNNNNYYVFCYKHIMTHLATGIITRLRGY